MVKDDYMKIIIVKMTLLLSSYPGQLELSTVQYHDEPDTLNLCCFAIKSFLPSVFVRRSVRSLQVPGSGS